MTPRFSDIVDLKPCILITLESFNQTLKNHNFPRRDFYRKLEDHSDQKPQKLHFGAFFGLFEPS